MSFEKTLSTSWTCATFAWNKALDIYKDAQEPSHTQNAVLATARSIGGIIVVSNFMYETCAAVVVSTAVRSTWSKNVNKFADDCISGVWDAMSLNTKICVVIGGTLALYIDPTHITRAAGTLIACKIGLEVGQMNYGKEEIAQKKRAIKEEAEKLS